MMNSTAINVTDLRVDRGDRTVLDDLTFTIPPGAVTGLLGPSGCGSENAPLTRKPGLFELRSAAVRVASPPVEMTVAVVPAV